MRAWHAQNAAPPAPVGGHSAAGRSPWPPPPPRRRSPEPRSPCSGTGSVGFLVSAICGQATGTGHLTYTDGTTQDYTLTAPDWLAATPPSGTSVAVSSAYRNGPDNTRQNVTSRIFSMAVPLASGKTLSSVTLPSASTLPLTCATPALHVFAADVSNHVVSLRAHANGKYMTAPNGGASPLIAGTTSIGPPEEFDLIDN
ncbi:hypothetical protein AB0A71_41770 [Kitasatospora aureofaciens]|uniref:fascin domain-containing protein n=1 Tax=Kitasatospora aureofaciens TaxID=1894 RepID=UPI00340DC37D